MQAQQALTYRKRSFGTGIAVVATLIAAALALALVETSNEAANSVTVGMAGAHQQAPDAADRNAEIRYHQADGPQADLTRVLPATPSITPSVPAH